MPEFPPHPVPPPSIGPPHGFYISSLPCPPPPPPQIFFFFVSTTSSLPSNNDLRKFSPARCRAPLQFWCYSLRPMFFIAFYSFSLLHDLSKFLEKTQRHCSHLPTPPVTVLFNRLSIFFLGIVPSAAFAWIPFFIVFSYFWIFFFSLFSRPRYLWCSHTFVFIRDRVAPPSPFTIIRFLRYFFWFSPFHFSSPIYISGFPSGESWLGPPCPFPLPLTRGSFFHFTTLSL